MKRRLALVILFLFCFHGCSVPRRPIEPKWRPLVRIIERPGLPGVADSVQTTIGGTVFVRDLEKWLKNQPPGSTMYNDTMAHEMVHSWRMFKYGTGEWLRRYSMDPDFRLHEEKLAYWVGIQRRLRRGEGSGTVSHSLATHYFGMIDEPTARQWVTDVVAGRWKPDPGELPDHPEIPTPTPAHSRNQK